MKKKFVFLFIIIFCTNFIFSKENKVCTKYMLNGLILNFDFVLPNDEIHPFYDGFNLESFIDIDDEIAINFYNEISWLYRPGENHFFLGTGVSTGFNLNFDYFVNTFYLAAIVKLDCVFYKPLFGFSLKTGLAIISNLNFSLNCAYEYNFLFYAFDNFNKCFFGKLYIGFGYLLANENCCTPF